MQAFKGYRVDDPTKGYNKADILELFKASDKKILNMLTITELESMFEKVFGFPPKFECNKPLLIEYMRSHVKTLIEIGRYEREILLIRRKLC